MEINWVYYQVIINIDTLVNIFRGKIIGRIKFYRTKRLSGFFLTLVLGSVLNPIPTTRVSR